MKYILFTKKVFNDPYFNKAIWSVAGGSSRHNSFAALIIFIKLPGAQSNESTYPRVPSILSLDPDIPMHTVGM
jgi:hypothetical protein